MLYEYSYRRITRRKNRNPNMIYPTLLHTLLKALQQDQREKSSNTRIINKVR